MPDDLYYLFLLEDAKTLLEVEQRIFCELHHHIDMSLCLVNVVQSDDVWVRQIEEELHLTNQVLAYLEGVLLGD